MAKKSKESAESKPKVLPWELPNGHHMASRTGFEVEDGAVYLAPTHSATFHDLKIEKDALQAFMNAQSVYLNLRFQQIAERQDQWWENVCSDLGIPKEYEHGDIVYNGKRLVFRPTAATLSK